MLTHPTKYLVPGNVQYKERNGQAPKVSAVTPEHKCIKELEKRIRDIGEQNEMH